MTASFPWHCQQLVHCPAHGGLRNAGSWWTNTYKVTLGKVDLRESHIFSPHREVRVLGFVIPASYKRPSRKHRSCWLLYPNFCSFPYFSFLNGGITYVEYTEQVVSVQRANFSYRYTHGTTTPTKKETVSAPSCVPFQLHKPFPHPTLARFTSLLISISIA